MILATTSLSIPEWSTLQISDKQVDMAVRLMELTGHQPSVLIDTNWQILHGHIWFLAARKLAKAAMPVYMLEIDTTEQAKAAHVVLNALSWSFAWDPDKVDCLFEEASKNEATRVLMDIGKDLLGFNSTLQANKHLSGKNLAEEEQDDLFGMPTVL